MADVDPDEAREQARQVLDGDRYRSRDVPRPLRGVLEWIGERMQDVAEPIGEVLSTPGGVVGSLLVVGVGVALLMTSVVRRRTRTAEVHQARRRRSRRPDPTALEGEAEAAETAGDLAGALRLRFRAGVVRLEDADVVPRRADATTGRLRELVDVPAFGGLARTFDEVAYGGRPATLADVTTARRDWPAVVRAARASATAEAGP